MSRTRRSREVWVVRRGKFYIVRFPANRTPRRGGSTQRAAIAYARRFAGSLGYELIVQNRHGRIRIKDSHGRDPFPPKG